MLRNLLIGLIVTTIFLWHNKLFAITSHKPLQSTANVQKLSQNKVWHRLLHYNSKNLQGEIHTNGFYLSKHGKFDPLAELKATITAYSDPWKKDGNKHPRCRYPARYFWLKDHISLPDYKLREPRCTNLENWALFDSAESISLLLVSGYFGNPASTFGHSLLRINTAAPEDHKGLFDLAINFGAIVPEKEPTPLYIYKGLFGGYKAGFSDRYFYTQDIVYSRTEYRDIWDYKLNLTKQQRTLLLLHMFEVNGKQFTYFFLDENCVYRFAELLELITDENFLQDANYWYIPTDLFRKLEKINTQKIKAGKDGIIKSVTFIPSAQRLLYQRFAKLSKDEVKTVNLLITNGLKNNQHFLYKHSTKRQAEILDTLLEYQQYRLISEEPEPSQSTREAKDTALLSRLKLDVISKPIKPITPLPSPAKGSASPRTSLGISYEENNPIRAQFSISPFSQELLGNNSLENGELVLFETVIGWDEKDSIDLDRFDLVRVKKFDTPPVPISGESPWAWKLRIGVDREYNAHYNGLFMFGIGQGLKFNSDILLLAMLDTNINSELPHLQSTPNLGLLIKDNNLQAFMSIGELINLDKSGSKFVWDAQLQYQFSPQWGLRITASKSENKKASIELVWH
ncbi:MAG: DUF4105 domain-containing protein [Magnetococcales bacterium]|nr:DUF4105 domain-containing protein [Magnetococcales bacterium]